MDGRHAACAPPANNQYIGLDDRVVTPHNLSLRLLGEIRSNPQIRPFTKEVLFLR
jgi:hypothetical protein